MRSARIIGADVVCYLPFDKPRNVKKFLDIVNPCMAFFIKYEFWKNYLDELHRPPYSRCTAFLPFSVADKYSSSGMEGTYRHVLRDFDHLFVQNERSKRYLAKIGITVSRWWGIPVLTVCCRFVRRPRSAVGGAFQERHDDFCGRKLMAAGRGFVY